MAMSGQGHDRLAKACVFLAAYETFVGGKSKNRHVGKRNVNQGTAASARKSLLAPFNVRATWSPA